MLNLLNYLTKEDNEKIENYIKTYGLYEEYGTYIGNEIYLSDWADNKKKLFHLLNGNFIYKINDFEIKKPENELKREVQEDLILSLNGISFFSILNDILEEKFGCSDNTYLLKRIFSTEILTNNSVPYTVKVQLEGKKMLQISEGMKPMKALQQLLKYCDIEDTKILEMYEELRLIHSRINQERKVKGTLCLSIHPLDFITASHNSNNWSSCLDWSNHGAYCAGTVEMMNSNCVIVAYLESSKPFYFGTGDNTDCWNSKRWRQFFVVNKDIILSGKSYPFQDLQITTEVLKKLRALAQENWNQTYEYGIEDYMDMVHIGTWYRLQKNRWWIQSGYRAKKHNILIDTDMMYNDWLNDHDTCSPTKYLCIRNKVKRNRILHVSGPAKCICCGDDIKDLNLESEYNDYPEEIYNDRFFHTNSLYCKKCLLNVSDQRDFCLAASEMN